MFCPQCQAEYRGGYTGMLPLPHSAAGWRRHASIQMTMNVYGRAMTETKRLANGQVVGLLFGPNSQKSASSEASATQHWENANFLCRIRHIRKHKPIHHYKSGFDAWLGDLAVSLACLHLREWRVYADAYSR
jgi:hypothetical protein